MEEQEDGKELKGGKAQEITRIWGLPDLLFLIPSVWLSWVKN
jgi:hypothetical protein